MEAKELRIGNYLIHDGYFIKSYSVDGFINIIKNISNYKPIPLTEEWLVKFGFVKDDDYDWYSICFFTDCKELAEKMTISINLKSYRCAMLDNIDGDACYTSKIIKHVHKLQNLYFALTNEEL